MGWKSIPKVKRKTRVAAADYNDQMIFECLNGALSRVGLVQLGGHKLKRDSLAADIYF